MESVRLSQLKGNNSCYSKRSRDLNLSSGKDDRYEQFAFQKTVVKNWFWSKSLRDRDYDVKTAIMLIQDKLERDLVEDDMLYVYDGVKSILRADGRFDLITGIFNETKAFMVVKLASRKDYVKDLILRTYRSYSFDTRETARLLGETVSRRIFRYLDEEERSLTVPAPKDLVLFGQEVKGARPDLLYRNVRTKTIEAIRIRCGKPDCSARGRAQDRNILNNKELYGIYAYARSEAAKEKDPEDWAAKGSYYFLRKDSDRTDHLVPGFFSDEKRRHICTLSGMAAEIDKVYEPQFKEYIIGHDCDGDDCLDCDWYQLCHFAEAPLKTEVERREKPLSGISLSDKQDEVVRHRHGIMRCNAGAGSGKTTVVALNTAFMIAEGIDPASILLITFSNAGAREMKDRTSSYLKGLGIDMDVNDIRIVTFNEFGQDILNTEFGRLGFTAPPRPIDATERSAIIARLLDKKTVPGLYYENINLKFKGFGGARLVTEAAFEIIKRDRLSVYDVDELRRKLNVKWYSSIDSEDAYQALLELYEDYDETLRSRNLIEFADQEAMIFDILDIDPYYFDKMGYKHIIIDEFQDTSKNQMEIIKQLLDVAAFESLLVVGDDSQAIYSWRDADSGNIIEFEDRIGQPVKDVNLVENHRSTPEILEFANKVNALNIRRVEKDLVATRPSGKPVTVKAFYKVDKEYEYIVSVVKEKIKEGYAPEDIAILARTKTEIVKIAGKLTDEGIESSLQAPQKMLENSRVQGICSLARAYKDYTATKEILIFQNCLEGGKVLSHTDEEVNEIIDEGQQTILHLRSLYEPKKAEAFRELAKEIAAEDDVAINLAERLGRFVTTDEMVSYIDAFIRFDGEELKREGLYSGVVLSTAHSSKGLEWPVIINSITKYDKKDGMGLDEREENRRLLFVSATRARDELFITGQVRLSGTAETGFAYNEFVREAAEIVGVNISDVREEGKKESDEKREKRIKEVAEKTERKARKKA